MSAEMVDFIKNDPSVLKKHEEAKELLSKINWEEFLEMERSLGRSAPNEKGEMKRDDQKMQTLHEEAVEDFDWKAYREFEKQLCDFNRGIKKHENGV